MNLLLPFNFNKESPAKQYSPRYRASLPVVIYFFGYNGQKSITGRFYPSKTILFFNPINGLVVLDGWVPKVKSDCGAHLLGILIIDDYITKPCDPEELVLRIQNILRRSHTLTPPNEIHIGTYVLNQANFVLIHENETFRLTEREMHLLSYLWARNHQVVTREQILEEAWMFSLVDCASI
ncbi:response regulator transcription factor [Sphingobacterium sp. SYP-B4668]|uniref:response regulator transcription factor n=1 Tax=Sphingobacterium sp. SYP-B4668 TaxID=2996035 RepID=UPI0022DDA109|nr:winged helix-turn-helix domain-containing protein [Sphingobacterium sp. SYP-B4668]